MIGNPPLKPEEKRAAVQAQATALAGQVEELTDEEIEAAHKALMDLEIQRLFRKMVEGADEDMRAGKLDPEDIDKSIKEFRARHPYR